MHINIVTPELGTVKRVVATAINEDFVRMIEQREKYHNWFIDDKEAHMEDRSKLSKNDHILVYQDGTFNVMRILHAEPIYLGNTSAVIDHDIIGYDGVQPREIKGSSFFVVI